MLNAEQASLVKGMLKRGDRFQDIAAYFGENQGRVADVKMNRLFPEIEAAPPEVLPTLGSIRGPRFIDPNAPLAEQLKALDSMIRNPPEGSRVIVITSQVAEAILRDRNDNNRRKRPTKIRRFSEHMTSPSGWGLTGDTIKFGKSGLLLDGQNRLSACVRAGVPFRTHVVFGIDDNAFPFIDTNAVRTNPDTLQIAGVPHAKTVAQAVRWLIIYEGNPMDRGRVVENDELLAYYRKHVDADQMNLAIARANDITRLIPRGALAAHLYMFDRVNAKATARFADHLAKGIKGGRKLTEKFDRLRKQTMGRINEIQSNALIIQGFNAYRKNVLLTMPMLNWTETKDYPGFD
jgi:hypothetical protein